MAVVSAAHGRWRRTGLAVSALLAGALAVAACGPSISNDAGDGDALTLPEDFEPSGEITIWDRSGDLFQVFDTVIERFNEKYPDIKVNHLAVDIDAKLANTLISGAEVPDGTFIDDSQVSTLSPHLYDLTELLAPYEKDIVTQKLAVGSKDGRFYGVPWDLDPGLLYYRADVLEDAGVDPDSIATYDDLLEAARTVKEKNPDSYPIRLEEGAYLGQMWLEMFANQAGTNMTDEEGNLRLDSDEYRQILGWLQTVVQEDLGAKATYMDPTDLQRLDDGTTVFVPWSIWWDYVPQTVLTQTQGAWRAMLLPAWEEGGARSGAMGGSSFAIPKDAQNPELAWLFYEFLVFDPEGYQLVYGPNEIYPGGLNTSIPSYLPALRGEPLFDPVPALGDQNLWEIASQAANEVPGGVPTPSWWPSAVDYLGDNLQRLLDGTMTPDEVIESSTRDIQTNLVDRG
ncbi:carbohydrate ABC transporter substrate-binding protein (CUT1 family) [Salana multivorans]|uniref:Carbohydrate ABC transporter substrate-binding protein (CUT1 family) n=1 Tax=Salana multivorans TaxID=120377 RepID=A0A3N2D7U4_9MICO|nr:extracellular solute-binding protein [Salana multivorans]ROR95866.1 carbohydrate ABC transporter substrate-binding protein (CUT1 family) [Salana multivorans]